MRRQCLLPLLLFWLLAPAAAQAGWEQIRDEDGIQVYSSTVDGSDIIRVKTQVIIGAPLETIRRILDDAPRRPEWVPYLRQSRVLRDFGNGQRLEYSHFEAPWPATDRDFVYRIQSRAQTPRQRMFSMQSETSPLMPEQADKIRAELIESVYTLSALGPARTRVELVFHADLRGWLPVWINNIVQRHLPYRMLKNLRARAEAEHAD